MSQPRKFTAKSSKFDQRESIHKALRKYRDNTCETCDGTGNTHPFFDELQSVIISSCEDCGGLGYF
jgi:DnaJ-class molecular chaperone